MSTGASTAPTAIAATVRVLRTRSRGRARPPGPPARRSSHRRPRRRRVRSLRARDEEGDDDEVGPRVHQLRLTEQERVPDDDARLGTLVESRALTTMLTSPPSPRRRAGPYPSARAEPLICVEHQLHGLRAVGELDHGHDQEDRRDIRRAPDRGEALLELGGRTLGVGRRPCGRASTQPRDEQRREHEREGVDGERHPGRGDGEQDAPIAGPTTTPSSCTVCSSALAGPIRASPTRRGSRAIAAGRSAAPATEESAVSAITTAMGVSAATAAASADHEKTRSRSPISNTVRRS